MQTATDGTHQVRPIGAQHSHLMGDLAYANALIVVPEHITEVAAGQVVDTVLLERRRE